MGQIKILHTNDLHGKLTPERLPFLESFRSQCDLYLDSGDCVKAGNLAIPISSEPVWPLLGQLKCDASVPGNRESHPLEPAWKAKTAGLAHPMICANMLDQKGNLVLLPSIQFEKNGFKIGVVGTMVAMVTDRMASRHVSNFIWTDPISAAVAEAERLRADVDLLIALTHVGFQQDIKLAEATSHFDLVLGGHSHTVLREPHKIGSTWIAQGGSHARYAGVYTWDGQAISGALEPWQVDKP